MKLLIAGSRTVQVEPHEIHALVNHYGINPISEIVSGTAGGVDRCGEAYAKACAIPVTRFPADWEKFGRSAGHKRNAEMAQYADVLLLIWDGKSPGSASMKKLMEATGKPIFEAVVSTDVEEVHTLQKALRAGDVLLDAEGVQAAQSINQKVEYVKSQGQTRKHHCHWPGCDQQVPPAQWGCRSHWFKLPKQLRDRIWATYRPGQERTLTPSKAYVIVAREVQKWIEDNYKSK